MRSRLVHQSPIIILVVVLLVAVAPELWARPLTRIVQDFAPLQGYVVDRREDGVIVDLDAGDGLAVGDLLSVLGPAKTLTHPVTGEPLGTVRPAKAVLRVSRIASGFSVAHPLETEGDLVARGDRVRRFAGLQARFIDATGDGEALYQALREALPQLDWQGYRLQPAVEDQDGAALVFALQADTLEVRDAESQLIRAYGVSGSDVVRLEKLADEPSKAPVPEAQAPTPAPRDATPAYAADFPELTLVTEVPGKVTVADFTRLGGRLLLATTDGQRVSVYGMGASIELLARQPVPRRNRALALHWWQPESGRGPLLALTAWDGQRVQGMVLALRGNKLEPMRLNLPYSLGSFDLDGDGRPETLLGQAFDRKTFFGRPVAQWHLEGGRLLDEAPALDLPRDFTVQGSVIADITGNGQHEIAQVRDNILHIYSASGELLYQSGRGHGGSLSTLTYEVDPALEFSPVSTVHFELAPAVVDLNGDGTSELIAVAGDLSAFSAPGIDSSVRKSWLAVLQYRQGRFVQGPLGPELDLPLQGFVVEGEKVLLLTPESHAFFSGASGGSQLLSLGLRSD